MSDFKKDDTEIGALWEQQGRKGTYMTGKINGEAVVIFRNGNKADGSNAPDWRVHKPQKRERVPQTVPETPQTINDADIPF